MLSNLQTDLSDTECYSAEIHGQIDYKCRFDWGSEGAASAAERGDIIVIVDTLSFSTSVVTAVHNGGIIYPAVDQDDLLEIAGRIDAVKAVQRSKVPSEGRFSLSPETFIELEAETSVILASPNGASCCRAAKSASNVFVASLINAEAMGKTLERIMDLTGSNVTLIACGEQLQSGLDNPGIRFAIEDMLAVGAILSYILKDKSPEAQVCEAAFGAIEHFIDEMIWDSISGRELRSSGFGHDVNYSARMNIIDTVAAMENDKMVKYKG
ncbi:2-phosphosulfolactate phosphatase [bacterium]|nr:2-phosphosulfolactate phosphatase [bacterium]